MAKVALGARISPELMSKLEKEASETGRNKSEVVQDILLAHYGMTENDVNDSEQNENDEATQSVSIDYITHLKEQIDKKDMRIEDLERINNNYAAKILDTSKLIEAPNMSRWEHLKSMFR